MMEASTPEKEMIDGKPRCPLNRDPLPTNPVPNRRALSRNFRAHIGRPALMLDGKAKPRKTETLTLDARPTKPKRN